MNNQVLIEMLQYADPSKPYVILRKPVFKWDNDFFWGVEKTKEKAEARVAKDSAEYKDLPDYQFYYKRIIRSDGNIRLENV